MTASLLDLGKFVGGGKSFDPKTAGSVNRGEFPQGTLANTVTLYSPDDDVHGALVSLIATAQHSVVVAMYGFDDDALAKIIQRQCFNPLMFVSLSLDSSQAGGVHERKLLAAMNYPGSSIAFGRSEEHAIMHMKMVVIDGRFTITGSTNWSTSGETAQDNQLTVVDDALHAARARTKIDIVHDVMLQQMAATERAALLSLHK